MSKYTVKRNIRYRDPLQKRTVMNIKLYIRTRKNTFTREKSSEKVCPRFLKLMKEIPGSGKSTRGLFTETRKAVILLDISSSEINVESFNKSFRDLFQVETPDSALKILMESAIKPEKFRSILQSILEGKKMDGWKLEINCRDGLKTFRVENIDLESSRSSGKNFLIFSDVTSQKAREEKIKSFQRASMDFIDCRDDGAVAEKISEIAGRDLGFESNTVRLADEERLKVFAYSGLDPGEDFLQDYDLHEDEAAVKCFRTGKTVYSSELAGNLSGSRIEKKDIIHTPLGNYGVITCFVDNSRSVDSTDIELLQMLGRTGNFVINFVRQQPSSFEDSFTELELHSEESENLIADLAEQTDEKFRIISVSPRSGVGEVFYIKKEDKGLLELGESLENYEEIQKCSLPNSETGEDVLRVETTCDSFLKTIIGSGVRIKEVSARPGILKVLLQVSGRLGLGRVFERLRRQDSDWELVSKKSVARRNEPLSESDLRDELTSKQLGAVEEAFNSGYYSYPRESTAEEIASTLGISDSTLFQHLQAAHRKIIRRHLGFLEQDSYMSRSESE